jgi:hypothetical protein
MIAQYLDLTNEFNGNGGVAYVETSNYDYCVIQTVGASVGLDVYSTLDSGAIQGVTDGNILTSESYQAISFTDLASLTDVGQLPINGICRIKLSGRYLKIEAPSGGSITKLLIMLSKIG